MSAEENKDLVRRVFEEVWNTGKYDRAGEFVATDFVDHGPIPGQMPGLEGVIYTFSHFRKAFPDIHYAIEDLIGDGDKVVVRATMSGTHQGAILGIAPTGRRVSVSLVWIFRIADGKEVERWGLADIMSLMQQLGAIAAPGPSRS